MTEGQPGMTLRDWFAGYAMKHLIQGGPDNGKDYLPAFNGLEAEHDKWVVKRAYEIADEMLAARAPKGGAA